MRKSQNNNSFMFVTLGAPFLHFDKDIKVRKHNIMIIEHINHIYDTIKGS